MRKRPVFLFLILVLICSFILSFAGCEEAAGESTTSSETSTDNVETFRLIPVSQEDAVAPKKKTYPDEIQAILDEYYQKMLEECPSWERIPRKMVREHYSEINGYVNVTFTFCLGGINTGCKCRFSTSRINPEGKWKIDEDGFTKYYTCGVTQAQMDHLRERLALQIEEKIEQQGLIEREPVRDYIHPVWRSRDGELYAEAEYIAYYANPPKNTDPDEFVSDHEHLFASIKLE